MARLYVVTTEAYGEILKTADNIREARTWAKRAGLGTPVLSVRPWVRPRSNLCTCCGMRPCLKRRKFKRGF